MTAPITKLPWRKPKIIVVETAGPMHCCKMYTLYDGRRIIVPGTPPIVTEALNVEAWIKAIAEIIRPLGQHDFYTSVLAHYAEVAGGPLQALKHERSPWQFGLVLHEIAISGKSVDGCYLKQIPGDRKRARWLMVFPVRS